MTACSQVRYRDTIIRFVWRKDGAVRTARLLALLDDGKRARYMLELWPGREAYVYAERVTILEMRIIKKVA
jgi:hypothetical protein